MNYTSLRVNQSLFVKANDFDLVRKVGSLHIVIVSDRHYMQSDRGSISQCSTLHVHGSFTEKLEVGV